MNSNLADGSLVQLSILTSLESLALRSAFRLSENGFLALLRSGSLRQLTRLEFHDCRVSDVVCPVVALKCAHLVKFCVSKCHAITIGGITALICAAPCLRRLQLGLDCGFRENDVDDTRQRFQDLGLNRVKIVYPYV